jgi:arylsulfatase A-like enzyme
MSLFYGEVNRTDESAGRLLDKLDDLAIRERTLFIFTTDHGIAMPYAKGTLYDPGLKIACILSWPGVLAASTTYEALSSNVDLLPTVMEAVGHPELIPTDIDGQSLWNGLAARTEIARDHLYAEMTWHDFYEPMRAIRTESHKLIRNFEPGTGLQLARDIMRSPIVAEMRASLLAHPHPEYEFYDLLDDPLERNNLAGQVEFRALETRMRADLNDWLESTSDPILAGRVPPPKQYFSVMDTNWSRRLP